MTLTLSRERLVGYKGMLLTPDTASALALLEEWANEVGRTLRLHTPQLGSGHDPLSLLQAGREVHITLHGGQDEGENLYTLWGGAVPRGWTPRLRDPVLEEGHSVFRFFGPWQAVYDRMLAEGRGHLAFSSMCCAAQVDVGRWGGADTEARFIQAGLHRLGRNPGPVDGVIGPRTLAALEALLPDRPTRPMILEYLRTAQPDPSPQRGGNRGHLLIPGHEIVIASFGGVQAWRVQHGAAIQIQGPGRLVVDVR
jgi:hypothetical protein